MPEASEQGGAEDGGHLVSVLYNSTSDESVLAVFDAATLHPVMMVPMGMVVPFHAHGVVCPAGENCYTNP